MSGRELKRLQDFQDKIILDTLPKKDEEIKILKAKLKKAREKFEYIIEAYENDGLQSAKTADIVMYHVAQDALRELNDAGKKSK